MKIYFHFFLVADYNNEMVDKFGLELTLRQWPALQMLYMTRIFDKIINSWYLIE